MVLNPGVMASARHLKTVHLSGAAQYCGGQIVFSNDERFLISVTGAGHLQVWDLATFQPVSVDCDHYVRKIVPIGNLGGFLAIEEQSVVEFRATDRGFGRQVLVCDLPQSAFDDESMSVVSTARRLVVCSSRWQRVYSADTFQMLSHAEIIGHQDRIAKIVRINTIGEETSALVVSASYGKDISSYIFSSITAAGTQTDLLSVELEDFELVQNSDAFCGIFRLSEISALILIDCEGTKLQLARIRSTADDSPIFAVEGVLYSVSGNGWVLAIGSAKQLSIWRRSVLIRSFECDGTWYNARLSTDGLTALITYCNGVGSPNLSGIVDVSTGEILGQCRDHMCGVGPYGFSRTSKFCATVLTDDIAGGHPERLPSGTIIVTELF